MDEALEILDKQELIALIKRQDTLLRSSESEIKSHQSDKEKLELQVQLLKERIAQLERMKFGQSRERFEADPNQMALPFETTEEQKVEQEEVLKEQITYTRKKASQHRGRVALPDHLPVEEIEIHPAGDMSDMVCIGKEITDELEYEPARYFIRRYIRYKYAPKDGQGVKIGQLPERVIEKGIPGAALLASIVVDKYMDHMPLYRQKQRFARENIPIASSTLQGWTKEALILLEPLYHHLLQHIKSKGYLQVDETPIKVLESNKKGACHQGYYWVYYSPIDHVTLFEYQPNRENKGVLLMLKDFKGYLQTDGYAGYEKVSRQQGIIHLSCWSHARREFERALASDSERAEKALIQIQQLYAVERKAREQQLDAIAIKELRLSESLPILNELGKWISSEIEKTLPKSQIGKAMYYSQQRWDSLSAYLYDGMLQIDNNLVENSIRPIALGRKNYLFAGNHDSAQRAAMIYSFFSMCKKHEVNPFLWLKYTLQNIMSINHKNITDLFPQNYNKILQQNNM